MMKEHRITMGSFVCGALLIGLPGRVLGDDAKRSPGQWIRVTTNSDIAGVAKAGTRLEGSLQSLDENRLVLGRNPGSQPVTVPRAAIARLDVRERASSRGKAALIGAGVGLVAGVSIGLASGNDECDPFFKNLCWSAGQKAAIYSLLTVPAGALLGLAFGHGSKWRENVAVERLRISFGPAPGRGVRLAVTKVF